MPTSYTRRTLTLHVALRREVPCIGRVECPMRTIPSALLLSNSSHGTAARRWDRPEEDEHVYFLRQAELRRKVSGQEAALSPQSVHCRPLHLHAASALGCQLPTDRFRHRARHESHAYCPICTPCSCAHPDPRLSGQPPHFSDTHVVLLAGQAVNSRDHAASG